MTTLLVCLASLALGTLFGWLARVAFERMNDD